MTKFTEIPRNLLMQFATEKDHERNIYYAGNFIVRRFFWLRLYFLNHLMNRFVRIEESCLDFGGGSGVMAPTLATRFLQTTLIDLNTDEAKKVLNYYCIQNIEIITGDINSIDMKGKTFRNIVAADVLEHFQDLSVPVKVLHQCLGDGGLLFTSLPTENWLYVLLRKIFRQKKPIDHYHSGYEVEQYLKSHGFSRKAGISVPLYFPIFPLFLLSVWRKEL